MKKMLLIVGLLLGMMATDAGEADAQVRFGVKGGLNLTQLHFDSNHYDVNPKVGFLIGPTVMFSLPVKGLALDGALLFDQRAASATTPGLCGGPTYRTTLKRQQLVLPIHIRYGFALINRCDLFAFFGHQLGVSLRGSKSTKMDYGEWEPKAVNFSLNAGLGMMLGAHLQLSANYSLVLHDDADIAINRDNTDGGKVIDHAKMNVWQLSLAYYF